MSIKNYGEWLKESWAILATLAAVLWGPAFLVTVGGWTIYGPQAVAWARDELGITELQAMVADATGMNRVIHVEAGGTYIREPVYLGDGYVILVMTFARTEVGQACIYEGMVPIFTGEDGVETTGTFFGPGRQYGTSTNRSEMKISLPAGLMTGRTTLLLQIEYTCGGQTVFEYVGHRSPIIFRILPGARP